MLNQQRKWAVIANWPAAMRVMAGFANQPGYIFSAFQETPAFPITKTLQV
jgi:hypothetical protein